MVTKLHKPSCPRFREHEAPLVFQRRSIESEGIMGALPEDVNCERYKVRFTGTIFSGYKVNLLRRDGTSVGRDIKIRRLGFEKSVEDEKEGVVVALKLSFNAPWALRITELGEPEPSAESINEAIENLSRRDADSRIGATYVLARAAREGFDIRHADDALNVALADEDRRVRANAVIALVTMYSSEGDGNGLIRLIAVSGPEEAEIAKKVMEGKGY